MKKIILHTKLFNKDTSLDIVRKSIKILTVVLKVVWREVLFLCYVEEKSTLFS